MRKERPARAAVSTMFHSGMEIVRGLRELDIDVATFKSTEELRNILASSRVDMVVELNIHAETHRLCSEFDTVYAGWAFDSGKTHLASIPFNDRDFLFLHNRDDYEFCASTHPNTWFLPFSAAPEFVRSITGTEPETDILMVMNTYYSSVMRNDAELRQSLRTMPGESGTRSSMLRFVNLVKTFVRESMFYYTIDTAGIEEKLADLANRCGIMVFCDNPDALYEFSMGIGQEIAFLQRTSTASALAEDTPIDVFGDEYWGKLAETNSNLAYHGMAEYSSLPDVYCDSKINICLTQPQCLSSIPQRVFHVLAAGGFLLVNRSEVLTDLFEPGKHLDVFSSLDELKAKSEHYLSDPVKRMAIAKNGQSEFMKNHQMKQRLEFILETCTSVWG